MHYVFAEGELMETNQAQYKNWALIAVTLLLFGTAIAATQYKVPVIMGDLMVFHQMDASSASWLMSIFTFVGIVLAIPTGALAKKVGPKNVLIAAAFISLVGAVLGMFASGGMMLIVSRGVEGVAFIFVTICGPLCVQKYVSPDKIGSATGIWALWVCLGSVVGGVATASVFGAFGFAGTWIFYGVLPVIFIFLVIFVVKLKNEPAPAAEAVAEEKASYSELLKPNTLLFFAGFLCYNMTLLAVLSFSPTWLQSQGMDATLSGFVSTLPMLLACVSSTVFGVLSDKMGRCKPLYIIASLAMGPCAFLLLATTGAGVWAGAILMGLIGLGGPVMCLTSYIDVLGKPQLMSIGMGFLMLVQSLGQFLGSFVPPMLLGPAGDQWMTLGIAMCVVGFIGTGAIALCRFK